MIIDLRTILHGSRDFEFSIDKDWWHSNEKDDHVLAFDTPLQAKIRIYRAGDKFVLDGNLSVGLQVRCDKCLETYHRDLRSVFEIILSLPQPETGKTEVELFEEDMEVDFIKGDEMDLDEIIRGQIYLALPMKFLCREDCLGLCPTCGIDLNIGKCHCYRGQGHPGFSKLKNLKIRED